MAELRDGIAGGHPRFLNAVCVDAAVTARYRSEHHEFRSRGDAAVQVVRLAWVTDAFFAQICVRAKVASRNLGIPILPTLLHHLAVITGQLNIGDFVVMAPGIYLPHGNVVVDGLTRIESGVAIRPYVTIGLVDGNVLGPCLEENARIGTGAKVVGPVTVGARANVGANAVVVSDVPSDSTAVGIPARVLTGSGSDAGPADGGHGRQPSP